MNGTNQKGFGYVKMTAIAALAATVVGTGIAVFKQQRQDVLVGTAFEGKIGQMVEGAVEIIPREQVEFDFSVDGMVRKVNAHPGQRVTPDTVVIELESDALELERGGAGAALDAARAQAGLPLQRAHELQGLKDQHALKERDSAVAGGLLERIRDLETILGQERVARSLAIAQAETDLAVAELALKHTRLTTGFHARISDIHIRPGQMVRAGQRAFRAISEDSYAKMEVSQSMAHVLEPGMTASIVFDADADGVPVAASVLAMAPEMDSATRRRAVFLAFDGRARIPGTSGYAGIQTDSERSGVLIPRRALQHNSWVLVVQGGRIVRREVLAGYSNPQYAEILSGLSSGEQVVLEGQSVLRPGDHVNPIPSTP